MDVMATAVDAAGASYAVETASRPIHPIEGRSLLPVLDRTPFERGPLFGEHEVNLAVRVGRWKLVAVRGDAWELNDMDADRSETADLAATYPSRTARMAEMHDPRARRAVVIDWAELQALRLSRN